VKNPSDLVPKSAVFHINKVLKKLNSESENRHPYKTAAARGDMPTGRAVRPSKKN
jgi:hypothetical protein